MNISLKPEQVDFIQKKLSSGQYRNAEQVIIEAFQLLEERDRAYQKWIEKTREKADVAIEELKRGEGLDGDVVITQLQEKLRKETICKQY
ncbi:MAG: type II toxin-antitoxin system ParD family antitoxin [Cyanobacteriota bacterium]|nr:type II toxin-antitoxin system ParD family antitoxin [Cyanobacteriota bacterium]